jgi:hypothetical protein
VRNPTPEESQVAYHEVIKLVSVGRRYSNWSTETEFIISRLSGNVKLPLHHCAKSAIIWMCVYQVMLSGSIGG